MTTHPLSLFGITRAARRGWTKWLFGLIAALCWTMAVLAFAGHVTTLKSNLPSSSILAVLGWALGLCAALLVAKLLDSPDLHD